MVGRTLKLGDELVSHDRGANGVCRGIPQYD